jgi:hypothetical protein
MKKLFFILPLFLIACGPSLEEIEAREKMKQDSILAVHQFDETEKQEAVIKNLDDKESYYSAAEFGVMPGEVEMFAPTDEEIATWRSAGGEIPDGKIYIQIKSETGKITVMECDYKTWVNIPVGSTLK